jgi:hypothetical protein
MRNGIRSKLTFANVLSFIAVFLVIGGSAYAGSKINGKKLKNNSVGPVKLHCPTAAPNRTGDICFGAANAPADWFTAVQNVCPSQNLRVPSSGEALLVTKAAGGETWTDDAIVEGPGGGAARVQNGVVIFAAYTSAHAYRCIAIAG